MTFLWPPMLLGLLLVPVFAAVYLRQLKRRNEARAQWGALGGMDGSRDRRRHIAPALMLAGLTLLLVGLARPQAMVSLPRVEGTVILAFDVSNSMRADDLKPSRLDAAKAAARAFVDNQPPTIRIGIVAFSGGGLVVQRPTDDRQAVLDTIDRLTPEGATSLSEGIFASLNALSDHPIALDPAALQEGAPPIDIGDFSSSVVLLLTDGENTESPDPLELAQVAADAGARIYSIGLGSPEGAVLELDGFRVQTRLDETILRQIADTTNGAYYRAEDEASLKEIYRDVDLQMTIRGEAMEITSVFAGAGLLVLLVAGGLALAWYGRMP
jgi:Ca-activated chloride channel family protein